MPTFDEIADVFQSADPELRLELLLDYSDRLPPLPERLHPLREAGLEMVHECQAPVFLHVEVGEDAVHLFPSVPREAPTARAFCTILHEAFDGASPEAVAAAPTAALHRLGLDRLLGMQRVRGLSAIYQRVKGEVARKAKVQDPA